MRNSTILVIRLRGVATESIKNMVLAGIGTLVVVDGEDVAEEDLGAGFFYRDEDFGKNVRRLDFERARIWSLIADSMVIESWCCQGKNRKPEPTCQCGDDLK